MAAKNVDIRINTTADTQGAKQATTAMQGLNTATKQVNQTVNTTTANTGKMGQVAGQAGYQIQDFAVQVGGGTNALIAFSQQAPQLLGVLGPGGAVAGAFVAIGAIATKVFMDIAENAGGAGSAMEDMSEKLKEAFGAQAKKMVEEFNQAIDNQTNSFNAILGASQDLYEIRNLQAETDAKLIKSQLALDEAAIKYLATTGQLVDEETALLEVRQRAAKAEADALIAASIAGVENEQLKLEMIKLQKDAVDVDVVQAQRKLAELEKQQQALSIPMQNAREMDKVLIGQGTQPEGFKSVETLAVEGQMEVLRKQIEAVYDVIESAPQRIQEITLQAQQQSVAIDIALAESQAEIGRINTELDLSSKAQDLNRAAQSITKDAAEITKEIATIEAITPVQQEAKAAIQKAASDGVITAQEQVEISRNLSVLLAGMKTGQAESINTVRDLIQLNNEMAIKMNAMNKEIGGIRERVKAIPIR